MYTHVISAGCYVLTNCGFKLIADINKDTKIIGRMEGFNKFMASQKIAATSFIADYTLTGGQTVIPVNCEHRLLYMQESQYTLQKITELKNVQTPSAFFECHSDIVSNGFDFFRALGFIVFSGGLTQDDYGLQYAISVSQSDSNIKILKKIFDMAGISTVIVNNPVLGTTSSVRTDIRISSLTLKNKIKKFFTADGIDPSLYQLRDKAFLGFLSGAVLASGFFVKKLTGDTKMASYEQKFNSLLNFTVHEDTVVIIENQTQKYLEFLQALCVLNGYRSTLKAKRGKFELKVFGNDSVRLKIEKSYEAKMVKAIMVSSELESICVKYEDCVFMLGGGACQE